VSLRLDGGGLRADHAACHWCLGAHIQTGPLLTSFSPFAGVERGLADDQGMDQFTSQKGIFPPEVASFILSKMLGLSMKWEQQESTRRTFENWSRKLPKIFSKRNVIRLLQSTLDPLWDGSTWKPSLDTELKATLIRSGQPAAPHPEENPLKHVKGEEGDRKPLETYTHTAIRRVSFWRRETVRLHKFAKTCRYEMALSLGSRFVSGSGAYTVWQLAKKDQNIKTTLELMETSKREWLQALEHFEVELDALMHVLLHNCGADRGDVPDQLSDVPITIQSMNDAITTQSMDDVTQTYATLILSNHSVASSASAHSSQSAADTSGTSPTTSIASSTSSTFSALSETRRPQQYYWPPEIRVHPPPEDSASSHSTRTA
jgi:hypothetical protein